MPTKSKQNSAEHEEQRNSSWQKEADNQSCDAEQSPSETTCNRYPAASLENSKRTYDVTKIMPKFQI
jgi:hypothetical protein